jgi:hypothetical protein
MMQRNKSGNNPYKNEFTSHDDHYVTKIPCEKLYNFLQNNAIWTKQSSTMFAGDVLVREIFADLGMQWYFLWMR